MANYDRNDTSIPASVRYNNPGASYPAPWMSSYGMNGVGIIGGGHKIAGFPSPVHGAAANFDLYERGYVGKPLSEAIAKWSGGNSSPAYAAAVAQRLGVSPSTVITRDMWRDQNFAPKVMSTMAGWESGGRSPITPNQWREAHSMYLAKGGQSGNAFDGSMAAGRAAERTTYDMPSPAFAPGGAIAGAIDASSNPSALGNAFDNQKPKTPQLPTYSVSNEPEATSAWASRMRRPFQGLT